LKDVVRCLTDHFMQLTVVFSSPEPRTPPVQGPINKEPDEKLYPDMHRTHPSVIRQM